MGELSQELIERCVRAVRLHFVDGDDAPPDEEDAEGMVSLVLRAALAGDELVLREDLEQVGSQDRSNPEILTTRTIVDGVPVFSLGVLSSGTSKEEA